MTWLRKHLIVIIGLLVIAYILLPNMVVVAFSFNKPASKFNSQWNEFSFDAWLNPCGAPGMCESLGLSLSIGEIGRAHV
jgi:spermidine/putrescine transport system permease protein